MSIALVQNGTLEAHGRIWPMYQSDVFISEALAIYPNGLMFLEEERQMIQDALNKTLSDLGYRGEIRLTSAVEASLLPEDQAEKERLDRESQ